MSLAPRAEQGPDQWVCGGVGKLLGALLSILGSSSLPPASLGQSLHDPPPCRVVSVNCPRAPPAGPGFPHNPGRPVPLVPTFCTLRRRRWKHEPFANWPSLSVKCDAGLFTLFAVMPACIPTPPTRDPARLHPHTSHLKVYCVRSSLTCSFLTLTLYL